jgi:hypothetical protein
VTKHGDDAAEREEVAAVAKKHGMTSPSFLDVDGAWSKASGLGNNPSYLVLGRDGKAVYRFAGKLTEGTADFEAIAKAIEEALGAAKG